jgi:hypothetical protein
MSANRSKNFHVLKSHFIKKQKHIQRRILSKHKSVSTFLSKKSKHIAVSSVTGLLMLAHPANASMLTGVNLNQITKDISPLNNKDEMIKELKDILPKDIRSLNQAEEISVAHILSVFFQMPVTASIEGNRLNRSYGIIGAEQHLKRYEGDNMAEHFQSKSESRFYSSGMAPGRGAWGYFAKSKNDLTQEDIDREKYYIAVQTFLSPGWESDPGKLYRFFKYKKMLVVNPENGRGVVTVIGDAGPAPFTGKHLGGSPEVMDHLERQDGGAKGPVLYFFIDDPNNNIPLGPINSNK